MNRNTDHGSPAIRKNNLFSKKKTIRNRRSRIFLFIKRLSLLKLLLKRKEERKKEGI